MTLTPKVGIYMSLAAAIISVLMLCGAEFTTLFGNTTTTKILAALGIFNVVINAANGVLHMIPAQNGPAGAAQFPLGPAVKTLVLLVASSLLGLMIAGTAQAQPKKPGPVSALQQKRDETAAPKKLTSTQVTQNPILLIQQFSVADLQAALSDAQSQTPPDTIGANCYAALLPVVQSGIANPLPAGPGLFQAIQKVRDAKALLANLQSPTGPLAQLNAACAPLILDGESTLVQLGVMTGVVAGTGGVGGTILPFVIPGL